MTSSLAIHFPAFSQSCVEVKESLRAIQANQYNLKTKITKDGTETEISLIELEKEYDKTLAQASILQGLNELNESFFRASRQVTTINEQGFDEIISNIDRVAKSGDLQVMQNMATMDQLLLQLKNENIISNDDDGDQLIKNPKSISIDYSSEVPIEDQVIQKMGKLKENCGESTNALCVSLKDDSSTGKELVKKFIFAFSANQDNVDPVKRKEHLDAYRAVLRNGMAEDTNLQAIFDSASDVAKNTKAFGIIEEIKRAGSAQGTDMHNLQRAYCCTLTDPQFNKRQACQDVSDFKKAECVDYIDSATTSFATIFKAYNNYEKEINSTLSYDFTFSKINDNPLDTITPAMRDRIRASSPVIAQYMDVLSGSIFGGGSSRLSTSLNDLTNKSQAIDNNANSMMNRINCIYKRGRLNLSGIDVLPTTGNINLDAVATGQMQDVVDLMNQKTCNLATALAEAKKQTVDACPKYFKLNPNDNSLIVPEDPALLAEIFKPGKDSQEKNAIQAAWASQLTSIEADLTKKRADIDALKSNNEYAHLEQLKRFMYWDLKSRCNDSIQTRNVTTAQCGIEDRNDSISYVMELAGDVGSVTTKLLAELDPATIANSDLSNASLSQRRIILGNMNGACQGLTRLNGENPNKGFSSNAIVSACSRIASMETDASKTTSYERGQQIERRGYTLSGDGNYRKKKSTSSQIGLGVLQGIGNSAGLLAGTYFQGRQLRDGIPFQEQYIYNQMDQQYAYDWYQQNAQPNYFYPGMNNPYYLPQLGGYSGGYNFNGSGL